MVDPALLRQDPTGLGLGLGLREDPLLARLSPAETARRVERERARQRQRRRANGERAERDDEGFDFIDLDDALLFFPRGIEGLVRSVGDLASLLPGVDTDFSSRRSELFGRSDTLVGGLLEGISQFLIPFGVARSGLAAAGVFGRLAASSRAAVAAGQAGRAGLSAGASRLVEGVVAGGAADLVAFSGQEQRLSDILVEVPALRNPVTEFLASDEDDSEIEGRLKNTLEGFGLGAFFDLLPAALRGIKAGRKALAAGEGPEAALRAADRAAGEGAAFSLSQLEELRERLRTPFGADPRQLSESELEGDPRLFLDAFLRGQVTRNQIGDPVRIDELLTQGRVDEVPSLGAIRQDVNAGPGAEPAAVPEVRLRQESLGLSPEEIREQELRRLRRQSQGQERAQQARKSLASERKRRKDEVRRALKRAKEGNPIPDSDFESAVSEALRIAGEGGESLEESLRFLTPEQSRRGLNAANRIKAQLGPFDPTLLERLDQLPQNVRAGLGLIMDGDLNLDQLDLADDAIVQIRGIESALKPTKSFVPEQEQLAQAITAVADATDTDPQQILATAATSRQNIEDASRLMLAHEVRLVGAANRTAEFARVMDPSDDESMELFLRSQDELAALRESVRSLAGEFGRSLRARQIPVTESALEVADELVSRKNINAIKNLIGSDEFQRRIEIVKAAANMGGPEAITAQGRFADANIFRKLIGATNEFIIGGLLSSARTLTTGSLFPTITAMYTPLENMLGGLVASTLGAPFGAAPAGIRTIQKNFDRLVGNFEEMRGAATIAKRAFREGPIFSSGQTREITEFTKAQFLNSETFDIQNAGTAFLIDKIGQLATIPPRLLTSADEFVRTFAGRASVKADLMERARTLFPEDKAQQAAYVQEKMDKVFVQGQLLTEERLVQEANTRARARLESEGREASIQEGNAPRVEILRELEEVKREAEFEDLNPIAQRALERTGEATATAQLERGTVGRSISDLTRAHPTLKLIAPFTKTPINLTRFVGQRLDLPILAINKTLRKISPSRDNVTDAIDDSRLRNLRALFGSQATEESRVEVMGRVAAGVAFSTSAFHAAQAGFITGGGPNNFEQRNLLLSTGWQPYSIRTPNGYVQYLRADPFSTLIGLAADLVDVSRFSDERDVGDLQAATQGIFLSFARNMTSKTYLTGVRSFLDAVTRGERFAGNFLESAVRMPIPRAVQSATVLVDDPVMREVNGIVDSMKSAIPGLSGDLPLQRDALGDPIMRALPGPQDSPASVWFDLVLPIRYREVKDDIISSEFRSLREGFSPPPTERFGVDLTNVRNSSGDFAYDVWGEQHGRVRIGGKTLRRALRDLIQSRQYQELQGIRTSLFERSPRAEAIGRVISRYREAAFEAMLDRFPGLRAEIGQIQRLRDRIRSDDPRTVRNAAQELQILGQ